MINIQPLNRLIGIFQRDCLDGQSEEDIDLAIDIVPAAIWYLPTRRARLRVPHDGCYSAEHVTRSSGDSLFINAAGLVISVRWRVSPKQVISPPGRAGTRRRCCRPGLESKRASTHPAPRTWGERLGRRGTRPCSPPRRCPTPRS